MDIAGVQEPRAGRAVPGDLAGRTERRDRYHAVRVLLVDDQKLFRLGVRAILDREADLEVVGEAGDGHGAVVLAQRWAPDVVLLDLGIAAPGGIEAIRELRRVAPDAPIVALASSEDDALLLEAFSTGSAALLFKDISPQDLVTVVRRVHAGDRLIDGKVFARPVVARRLLDRFSDLAVYGPRAAPAFGSLSPRQVEILDKVSKGMSYRQVAQMLSISEATVKNYMGAVYRKLSVNDRTQAVVYAIREGWIG